MTARLWAWCCATLVAGLFVAISNPLHSGAERIAYDAQVRALKKIEFESRILLVDLDEKSLAEVGPWPWPRARVGELIRSLTDHYQVNTVALDIVFPDPRADDRQLRAAVNHPAVILSQTFDMQAGSENRIGTLANVFPVAVGSSVGRAYGYLANHGGLLPAEPRVGHITPEIDSDGRIRSLYPVICFEQSCAMSLSLRMFQKLMRAGSIQWNAARDRNNGLWSFDAWADTKIPLDAAGRVWVPYRVQPSGFQYVSAADVLGQRVDAERLRNMVVIVGSTALGLGDRVATPVSAVTPGMEVHAQLLSSLLDGQLDHRREVSVVELLAVALIGGILLFVWPGRGQRAVLIWTFLMITVFAVAYLLLRSTGQVVTQASAMLLWFGAVVLFWIAFESALLNRQIKTVAVQFSHFLPPFLVHRLMRGSVLAPESENRLLTVLVADLRGFTKACEHQSPDRVALLAQTCLATLSAVVDQHGGTIEKFTGDGLMAIWGAAESDGQGAVAAGNAYRAAGQMQRAIAELGPWFLSNGFAPMQLSVGLNTGEMAVGIFGGAGHLAWTAQGDAVNVASRIEQLTRETGDAMLVGELTARLVGLSQFERRGDYPVKGRSAAVTVYGPRQA